MFIYRTKSIGKYHEHFFVIMNFKTFSVIRIIRKSNKSFIYT